MSKVRFITGADAVQGGTRKAELLRRQASAFPEISDPLDHISASSRWGAVFALTLCVATLIASEFMPVSLLTPIAADLRMTEGRGCCC